MVTEEKTKQVENLAQEIANSETIVFSDYAGLTVTEMTELRRKLSELGADFKVVKNTLLRRALEKEGLSLSDGLTGPTVALFSGESDPIESVKVLVTYLKDKGRGEVKSGFFEKVFIAASELKTLASLPGIAALQARLVVQLSAPIRKFAYLLSGNQQKLVSVLDRIATARGGTPQNAVAKEGGGESS